MGHDDNSAVSQTNEVHDLRRRGGGKLNRVSTHLKTEDIGIGTYKPTPLEIWMDRVSYEPTG